MLIKELGPFIWFALEKMIVNHCSTFKINLNRGPQCELYSGLSRNMVHISTEREGKKMQGSEVGGLSPPVSLSLPPRPMMLFRKCTMVDTCVLSVRTLLLFMCSLEGRKRARGAVKQAKAMLPHSLSLSFFYFPLSLPLPPTFYLRFIACVRIQAKGEACMKPSFCFSVISSV